MVKIMRKKWITPKLVVVVRSAVTDTLDVLDDCKYNVRYYSSGAQYANKCCFYGTSSSCFGICSQMRSS